MQSSGAVPFLSRALTVARAEFAALGALAVVALGVMTFVEIADDMTGADGQAFDQMVLAWMQPVASQPRGPWWLPEAAADLTSLGGISVLGLFAVIAMGFLLILKKRLSAVVLVAGLAGGVGLSEGLKALFGRARPPSGFQAVETAERQLPVRSSAIVDRVLPDCRGADDPRLSPARGQTLRARRRHPVRLDRRSDADLSGCPLGVGRSGRLVRRSRLGHGALAGQLCRPAPPTPSPRHPGRQNAGHRKLRFR